MQGGADDSGAGAFWAFSLRRWEKPGVEGACLALQDDHGADANLALFALFLAGRGARADAALARRARDAAERWGADVTGPLRGVRRGLGREGPEGELRAALGRTELYAERILQDRLEALTPLAGADHGDADALARANLNALIGAAADTDPARRLAALCSAGRGDPV